MKPSLPIALGFLWVTAPALAVESSSQGPLTIASCVVARDPTQSYAQIPGAASTNGVSVLLVNT
jgi:hypothetical protein